MAKTAIVYDKWLSSLGGGEVVACNIAKTLSENGYQTTFVSGKYIDPVVIKNKLGINLSNIKIIEIWNDEIKLRELSRKADVFFNTSFIDYSYPQAKQNIYYTFFPTKADDNPKGAFITKFVLPLSTFFITPRETISVHKSVTKYAFYYLIPNKTYSLNFKISLSNFSKLNLETFKYSLQNSNLISTKIFVNHFKNIVTFNLKFAPKSSTVFLTINNPIWQEISISPPEIDSLFSTIPFYHLIQNRLNTKLRAGLYDNKIDRINKYQNILATSTYTQKWIKKYWHRDATVLYPPVDLLNIDKKIKKKNQILSVGRFFTLGHSKKQEIMIYAFKKMCDRGLKNWELHLAGGLTSDTSCQEFVTRLKQDAQGYPIIFHFNKSRKEIEKLYQESKIYWHAAGFGIDPNRYPIKFEHFGITPIEAISAGCIPILFNGGGLSEVVDLLKLDRKVHLFSSVDQLIANTNTVIQQKIKLPTDISLQLKKLFSIERFNQELIKTISSV